MASACDTTRTDTQFSELNPDSIQSGYEFLKKETQDLQDDDFSNPGLLWIDIGRELFESGEASCSSCHTDGLVNVASSYPKVTNNKVVNLEGQINVCRETQQGKPAFDYESEELLSLTAFVASQSRGNPISSEISREAQTFLDRGRTYFFTRRGQMNLSCHQCHDQNWGKQLRGDTISQGHGNGFPAYRLEWQSLGSLHRRFHDCDVGVGAQPHSLGSDEYLALELYLAHRSAGLSVETPAVRR